MPIRCIATSVFTGIALFTFGHAQAADVTNLTEKVKALLIKLGPIPYTHKVERHVHLKSNCGIFNSCDVVQVVTRTDKVYLTASNFKISAEGAPTFGLRKDTELKNNQTVLLSQTSTNCDPTKEATMALAIGVSVAHTVTATVTKQAALAEGAHSAFRVEFLALLLLAVL